MKKIIDECIKVQSAHIHDLNIEDILKKDNEVWICTHC